MRRFLLSLYALLSIGNTATAQPVVIPVVFHILHQGGPENISDQQVLNEVQILNRDYNHTMTAADTIIAEPFRNIIADMGIEFRLANIDPNGNCTNGIEHIFSTATMAGGDNTKWPDWPSDKYLNIWVVSSISLEGSPGVAAYTYYPWIADTLTQFDGTEILYPFVGSIGQGEPFTSRFLTYEIGKYFGLLPMCYGNESGPFSVCGDDSVADTPPCKNSENLCEPDSSCGEVDNYQNFMSFSYCGAMFTNGQKARVMQYLNRSAAGRNNLWNSANLTATGTADTTRTPCAPVCDFVANTSFICLGASVTYYDISYNDTLSETVRTWNFGNSNITTSSNANVTVTYNAPGWQTVSLTVMNAYGSSQKTQTLVYVADTSMPAMATPYFTGFDNTADFNQSWVSVNPDHDAPHFQELSGGGVLLNNHDAGPIFGMYDDLISPPFDCSTLGRDSAQLSFIYSLASRHAGYGAYGDMDSLVVYVSVDCGIIWTKLYSLAEQNLFNAGNTDSYYIPGNNSPVWSKVTIRLYPYLQSYERFKIRVYGSETSNNFYLDDFTVGYTTTGLEDEKLNTITITPNPFSNYISINGLPVGKNEIVLYDLQGRIIAHETLAGNTEGTNINLSEVTAKGIYFVQITGAQGARTFKLVRD